MSDLAIKIRQNFAFLTAVVLFAVVYFLYNLAHPKGFSSAVFIQNSNEVFTLALVSMAQTVPVLAAGLDLSVGALMTMVACFASYLLSGAPGGTPLGLDFGGWRLALGTLPGGVTGIVFGAVICLLIGAIAGFINGAVVVYGRIQPIIATLATGAIYIGIALFLRPQPGGKVSDDLNWALTNSLGDFASTVHIFNDGAAPWFAPFAGIPTPFVLLALIVLLVWVPFSRTVTGRDGLRDRVGGRRSLHVRPRRQPRQDRRLHPWRFLRGLRGLFLAIQTSSGNADIPAGRRLYLEFDRRGGDRRHVSSGRQRRRDRLRVRRADPARDLLLLSHF